MNHPPDSNLKQPRNLSIRWNFVNFRLIYFVGKKLITKTYHSHDFLIVWLKNNALIFYFCRNQKVAKTEILGNTVLMK